MFLRPPTSADEWIKLVRSIAILEIISIGMIFLYFVVFWNYEEKFAEIEIELFGGELEWIVVIFYCLGSILYISRIVFIFLSNMVYAKISFWISLLFWLVGSISYGPYVMSGWSNIDIVPATLFGFSGCILTFSPISSRKK